MNTSGSSSRHISIGTKLTLNSGLKSTNARTKSPSSSVRRSHANSMQKLSTSPQKRTKTPTSNTRASRSHEDELDPIHNPSFRRNPVMWNAVALQQEISKNLHFVPAQRKRGELTLAQKLGLVKKPDAPLSETEWKVVEEKAKERKAYQEPCPICMEPYGLHDQLILSCSHVFHKACLTSFERFAGKGARRCPLCRKEEYQKRMTSEGKKAYVETAATKIQTLYRGYLARKQYTLMLLDKNPEEKRSFYMSKLSKISDKLVDRMEQEAKCIDKFLENIDKSLRKTRLAFITPADWEEIKQKALDRDIGDCPICMVSMAEEGDLRECTLTSCSHVFHERCLSSFERFTSFAPEPQCPVCRCPYQRHPFNF